MAIGGGTEVMGGGTVDVWWGAVDTAPPLLTVASDTIETNTTWSEIGEGFIDEDGFNADLQNTVNKVFVLKSTAPQRIYRTQEEPMFTFNLFESTIEAKAIGLHGGTGVITNPTSNNSTCNIQRGPTVREVAMLFRSVSPYDDDPDVNGWVLQGYLPRGVFTEIGSYKYYKEQVALPLTYALLESDAQSNPLEGLGWIEATFAA